MKFFSFLIGLFLATSLFGQSPDSLQASADALYKARKYADAQILYQDAFSKFKEAGQVEQAINAGIQIAECDRKTRKRNLAIRRLDSLLNQYSEQLETNHLQRANILHKKGANYYNLFEYPKAIEFFSGALSIRETQLDSNNRDIINGFHVIGACHQYRGDYENAVRFLQQSIDRQGKPPVDKRLMFQTYTELARASSKMGDYSKALEYFQAIVAFRQTYYADEPWLIASAYNDLVAHYTRMEAGEPALEYADKALDIYNKLDETYDEDFVKMANVYLNQAIAFEFIGDTSKAIQSYERSIQLNKKYNDPNSATEGKAYSNLGSLIIPINPVKANTYLEQAINILQEQEEFPSLGDALVNLGDLSASKKDWQGAIEFYQKAIQVYAPAAKFNKMDDALTFEGLAIGDKLGLLKAMQAKASMYWLRFEESNNQKDLELAHLHFQSVDNLVSLIRQDYQFDLSKNLLSEQLVPVYEKAILTAVERYKLNKDQSDLETAFRYIEKSKALSLLEAVRNSKAKRFAGIPDELLEQNRQTRLELLDLEAQISDEQAYEDADLDLVASLQNQRLEKRQTLNEMNTRFEKEYPDYFELKIQQKTRSLKEIQNNHLPEKKALIVYFEGDEYLISFLIRPSGTKVFTRKKTKAFKLSLDNLLNSITAYHLSAAPSDQLYAESLKQFSTESNAVYQFLFNDFESENLPEQLIVIPDGMLYYLPFELLIRGLPDNPLQVKSYDFLLRDYAISYQYSAAMWLESQHSTSKTASRLLSFAPDFDMEEDQLNPLPNNRPEVETIAKVMRGKVLLGKEATKEAFLKWAPQYSVIHLATHAQAPLDDQAGFLAFDYDPESQEPGRFMLSELYNLDLPCEMIVLSACETGIGTYQRGEGLLSLARGLTYAGAHSIITSYWQVDDAKTARLMERFYHHLDLGLSKDRALQQAKVDYLSEQKNLDAHPFFWAAFVGIGNMDALASSSGLPIYVWILFGLIAVFGLWAFLRRSRSAT